MAGEKSFALIVLVLMAIPALPIPTGGVTHIFEVIAMLMGLEMLVGRRTIWLPKSWEKRPLGSAVTHKTIPKLIGIIRWLEKYSRPRFSDLLDQTQFRAFLGLIIIVLALTAFLAPPFSGLDTVPALGAVAVSLGIILEDIVLIIIGMVLGTIGIFLDIFLGKAAIDLLHRI